MATDFVDKITKNGTVLNCPAEFDFDQCLAFLKNQPLECLHRIDGHVILKPILLNERVVLTKIAPVGRSQLEVQLLGNMPTSYEIQLAADYMIEWFDLDFDISAFYKKVENDPILGDLVRGYFGMRLMGIPDLFEALCWAIIGQQINLSFAFKVKRSFVELYGKEVKYKNASFFAFPSADVISKARKEDLRKMQFSEKKAEYILELATKFADRRLSKMTLSSLGDFQSMRSRLTSLRGIGPWTAEYALMKSLRDPSAFPIDDVGLQNAVKIRLNRKTKPDKQEMRIFAKNWLGFEAYATFYLWRSLSE